MKTIGWLTICVLLWLVPFSLVASRMSKCAFLPHRWRLQMTSAAVFTHHNIVWSRPVTLVRRQGNTSWSELPSAQVTAMPIAGYRYRWDRMVWEMGREKVNSFWMRAADQVEDVHQAQHGEDSSFTEVRFVKGLRRHTDPGVNTPEGHWKLPPFHLLPGKDVAEVGYCQKRDGAWVYAGKWKTESKPQQKGIVPLNNKPPAERVLLPGMPGYQRNKPPAK
jgi:hypothetical protein